MGFVLVRRAATALLSFVFGITVPAASYAGNARDTLPVEVALVIPPGTLDGAAASSGCEPIAPPPVSLETRSKYDQTVLSKSIVDPVSATARRQALSAAERPIGRLESVVRNASFDPSEKDVTACVFQNLRAWAAAGALTDMKTEDAKLTRDRLMVSITSVLATFAAKGQGLSGQSEIRRWLGVIAAQTIRFYDVEAGPTSRRNNHRYWAGLSVGQIGRLLGDDKMLDWARASADIGACQVDAAGFLPLELQRAAKAFDYHLYAYVALASLDDVLGTARRGTCEDGFQRLEARVRQEIGNEAAFTERTGVEQDMPGRDNLLKARRLIRQRRPEIQVKNEF